MPDDSPIIFGTVFLIVFLLTSRGVLLYNNFSRLPMGMSDGDKSFVNMYSCNICRNCWLDFVKKTESGTKVLSRKMRWPEKKIVGVVLDGT